MSAELVPINNEIAESDDRRATLERLNIAAETTNSPEEARAIMLQGSAASKLLTQIRAPFEEARLAGKASVVAARRLGKILLELSSESTHLGSAGWRASERTQLVRELGMNKEAARHVVELARAPDPDFQRYIQDDTLIPSVNGGLRRLSSANLTRSKRPSNKWKSSRRRNANVKTPANPSLDEAYVLVVRALGHLSAPHGGQRRQLAVGQAVEHLYAVEDLLKPYRAGYGE